MGNQHYDAERTDLVLKVLTAVGSLLTFGGTILGVSLGFIALYFVVLGLAVLLLAWSITRLWLPYLKGKPDQANVRQSSKPATATSAEQKSDAAQTPQPADIESPPIATADPDPVPLKILDFDDGDFPTAEEFKQIDLDEKTEDKETEVDAAFTFTEDDFVVEGDFSSNAVSIRPTENEGLAEDGEVSPPGNKHDEESGPIVFDESDFSDDPLG